MNEKWTAPSRKWLAARVTALAGLATMVASAGEWTRDATIMAITLVSAALLAYLLPNSEDAPNLKDQRGHADPLTLLIYVIVVVILVVVLFKVLDESWCGSRRSSRGWWCSLRRVPPRLC